MKIIIAPDKFKGSLSSFEACRAMEKGVLDIMPDAGVALFPMADGGDGFCRVLKHYLNTTTIHCSTVEAMGEPIISGYEWLPGNLVAIIETAAASGLAQVDRAKRDALKANTIGTGLLIANAIQRGAHTIWLGLGGSATTDMGTGILYALGFRFFNAGKQPLMPCGGNLQHINSIEIPSGLPAIRFRLACDVFNPLYGPNGAAFVYAPQKGADKEMVTAMDRGLRNANRVFGRYSKKDFSTQPGAGAAGGIAAGLGHFFDIEICSGASLVLESSGLSKSLAGADWLFTGEGRFDEQSLQGKLAGKLLGLANQSGVPCGIFCGQADSGFTATSSLKVSFVCPMANNHCPVEKSILEAGSLLTERVRVQMVALKNLSEKG